MTVAAGAVFDTFGLNNPDSAIGTVTLNGGIFLAASNNNYYSLNKLVVGVAGGTLVAMGSGGLSSLAFVGSGAGITINGNSTWIGPSEFALSNASGAEMPITIAPNATLVCPMSLSSGGGLPANSIAVTGGGTLYLTDPPVYGAYVRVVNHSRLRMDDLTTVTPGGFDLTLDAGTLAYGGATASSAAAFALGAGGGTVEVVNAATTLTLTGAIAGTGVATLTKAGPGTLALTNAANTYFGGLTVNAGRLDVSDDAQLGLANTTVNAPGILRYTASATTTRSFNLNSGFLEVPAGVTLTLDGAAVNGGFVRGPGTVAVGGGAALTGVTTAASAVVAVTGPATLTGVTNGGALTVATGLPTPTSFDLVTNQGSGSITVGAASRLNVSDFQTYGLLTLAPGPSTAAATRLTNIGATPLYFNGGSRTFIGTPQTAGQNLALVDLHGQNAIVAGGLFVNNGFVGDSDCQRGDDRRRLRLVGEGGGHLRQPGHHPERRQVPGRQLAGVGVVRPVRVRPRRGGQLCLRHRRRGRARPGRVRMRSAMSAAGAWSGRAGRLGDERCRAISPGRRRPADKLTVALETLLNPTTVGVDVPGPMDHFDPSRSYTLAGRRVDRQLFRPGRCGGPDWRNDLRHHRLPQPDWRNVRVVAGRRGTHVVADVHAQRRPGTGHAGPGRSGGDRRLVATAPRSSSDASGPRGGNSWHSRLGRSTRRRPVHMDRRLRPGLE